MSDTTILDKKWGQPDPTHDPFLLANFNARSTDVLITTSPKAGTTWMQQILHQCRTGGDPDFNSIGEVVPWLELPRDGKTWQQVLTEFEKMPDPRIFKTHCTYEQTPGVEVVKIILSSRDPRDCCVSFYHHIMDMTDEARNEVGIKLPESFDEYFEQWLEREVWYRSVKSWWPHINDTNVLWLRYEDMKTDLEASIDQILQFLGWSLSASQRRSVLHYCSFEWMRENVDKFSRQNSQQKVTFKPHGFIRKGRVGDHEKLMSPEQSRRILEKAHQQLEPNCINFLHLKDVM